MQAQWPGGYWVGVGEGTTAARRSWGRRRGCWLAGAGRVLRDAPSACGTAASPAGQAYGRAPPLHTLCVPAPYGKGRSGQLCSERLRLRGICICTSRVCARVCLCVPVCVFLCTCAHVCSYTLHVCLCAFARTHTCACAYVCYAHTGAYTRVRVRGEQGAESGTAAGGGAARCGHVGMDGTPCSVSVDAASPWPSGHVPWAALRSLDPELGRGRLSAGLARRRRPGCAPGRGPCPAVAGLCSPLGRAGVTGARPAPSVSAGRAPGPGLPRAGQADGSLGAPSEQGTAGWASPGLLHGRGRVARGSQWTVVGCAGQGAPSEATSLSVPAGEPGVCLTTRLFTFLAQRLRTLSGWGGRGLPR